MSSFAVVVARSEREARWIERGMRPRPDRVQHVCDTWDDKPVLVLTFDVFDRDCLNRLNAKLADSFDEAERLAVSLYS